MSLDYPEEIFLTVQKPSRYLGREPFFPLKDWDKTKLRVCLGYPDLYEIGRSHLGINILTNIINSQAQYLCDLVFAVAPDFEQKLKAKKFPLLSVNYKKPLREFQVIGLTYAYELLVTNILQILELSGIPPKSYLRSYRDPLIIGGGPCAGNPEPIAEIFDAFIIGDAEEAILEVLEVVEAWRNHKYDKEKLYQKLVDIEGVYVPSLKNYTKKRFYNLNERGKHHLISIPLIPLAHDRISIEVSRGCSRSCRFCEAGFYYRPVREKTPQDILEELKEAFKATGYREASLMSLSLGDYSALEELVELLNREFYQSYQREYIFSLPSLRVGSLTPTILDFLKRGRISTLTIAIEAASERLRRVINKEIDLSLLFRELELAQTKGFKRVKLYFMLGLPTEQEEDLREIVKLHRELKKNFKKMEITFSASIFVPKAHTPFQWERQVSLKEAIEKIDYLRRHLGKAFKHHNPEQSFLEGILSRGGRELLPWIELAYVEGARLASWEDYFSLEPWLKSAKILNLDLNSYIKERDINEVLPWEHIDLRVSKEFLLREREKALTTLYTKDCRWNPCSKCGVCDQEVRNLLVRDNYEERYTKVQESSVVVPKEAQEFWLEVHFDKIGPAKFLSQLEIQRLFELVLRRKELPLVYSQGFNPRPKFIFGPAIPVGIEVIDEVFWIALSRPVEEKAVEDLVICEGLIIRRAILLKDRNPTFYSRTPIYLLFPKQGEITLKGSEDFDISYINSHLILRPKKVELSILKYFKEKEGIEKPLEIFRVIKKYEQF